MATYARAANCVRMVSDQYLGSEPGRGEESPGHATQGLPRRRLRCQALT